MNIKDMTKLYKKCSFLTKESIVEIYEKLNALLDSLSEEKLRNCFIKGGDVLSFSTEGFIEFYSTTSQISVQHFPISMSTLSSISGMHLIAYIDVDLRKNVLAFGFDSDAIADIPKDSIQKFLTNVKTWFEDSYIASNGGFSISLDYFE